MQQQPNQNSPQATFFAGATEYSRAANGTIRRLTPKPLNKKERAKIRRSLTTA